MSKIGIFGGTFDPIHIGHLIIAEFFSEQLSLDKCIFIPALHNPLKDNIEPTPAVHRYNMLKLAIRKSNVFIADNFEINRNEPSYSIHTVKYLNEKYPDSELYLLIGTDNIIDFKKWFRWEEILQLTNLCCADRDDPNSNAEKKDYDLGTDIIFIKSPNIDISSTDIRERVRTGKSIKYLVTNDVLDYIKAHDLYANKS